MNSTKVSDYEVINAMETYGGGFVKALAVAFRRADGTNFAKLRYTFDEYWKQYQQMAQANADRSPVTIAD